MHMPLLQEPGFKISHYNPCDLFSQQLPQMRAALLALLDGPQNNLQAFAGGAAVATERMLATVSSWGLGDARAAFSDIVSCVLLDSGELQLASWHLNSVRGLSCLMSLRGQETMLARGLKHVYAPTQKPSVRACLPEQEKCMLESCCNQLPWSGKAGCPHHAILPCLCMLHGTGAGSVHE